ncbi:TetR/AcrR family transcriptional regulator [Streptomyces sp. AV19]|uniref:TetR/AcrR family transcriptional regulator n=1 Tax=Streptomyces sp. AV19 TaxID=2793068 RepID=UPI0018FEDAE7|nr:TetR/AcrR family transcriptional regulator [Streptomyces sp. AV19]MBH1933497.1 TetR/AcrR family transcriptional regulator [Streptomyces sp. AV19]MDG4532146.1 TetR/AcrR family transcriptional regulator [Streptomyces sp. AV19]
MTTATRNRRRMDVARRREQLIAVALDLFSRRPPEHVSLDDIATAAGISRPLVYHYFAGKQSLYEAVLHRAADDLAGLFAERRQVPPGTVLLGVIARFFDFAEEDAAGYAVLLRGSPDLTGRVREAAYAQLLDQLAVGVPGPRLEVALRAWISLTETTSRLWRGGTGIPRAEMESQLVHAFVAMTAASAAHDADMAAVLRRILAEEPEDGPFGGAVSALATL